MIEILTKICAKITIIIVENREPYYFIIVCKCKEVPLPIYLLDDGFNQISGLFTIRSMMSSRHSFFDFS